MNRRLQQLFRARFIHGKKLWVRVLLGLLGAAIALGLGLWFAPGQSCPALAPNQIAARWASFNFWQQHQNFAVFVLPQSLQHNPRVHLLLRVTGSEEFFMGDRTSDLATWENASPPPGFYLSRNYITTRTAWQLFWQGHRNTLAQPCHWVMVVVQRS